MKKITLFLLLLIIIVASCKKTVSSIVSQPMSTASTEQLRMPPVLQDISTATALRVICRSRDMEKDTAMPKGSFITPTQVMGTFSGDAFSYRDLAPLYLTNGIFTARAKP